MTALNSHTSSQTDPLPEWNLGDLYASPDDPALEADLKRARTMATDFASNWQGKLQAQTGKELARAVQQHEAMGELLGRIGSYAQLYYVGDTTDPKRAKFYGDISAALTDIFGGLLFFELELNRLSDAEITAALADPALAHYKPWLDVVRLEKPYQLEDKLEQLFLEKSQTGSGAFNRLFDETMAELRFDVNGESLALEPALKLMLDPGRDKRKAGGAALAKTFATQVRLFTLITNTLAKDKEISDKWRGFADVAGARHLSNRVEPEVVDALERAVIAAYPRLSHRYYRMKARWLGLERLEFWDRNAPLPKEDTRPISWAEARATVLDAYRGFAPEMADIANVFFEKKWIDAPVRPGKTSGAFSHSTVPSVHPYVLLNYMGTTRDVMTLAHELGHGVHQVLAARQGALMASTPLTLAETASVFGEMLTFKAILAKETSTARRKALLAGKVEDMLNTVVRQMAFYSFERRVHLARRQGELTPEDIGKIWMAVQTESLGDGVHLGEGYENFWVFIPHFIHSPFYVYAYAFGDCLVNSLYARYQESPEGFQERYFNLLRAGGTLHHSDLLRPFGLDASDPDFWQKGLSVIEGFIDELEKMEG